MDLVAALAAHLATLSQALDQPDVDLETQLQALIADLERAVTSYLGLRLTVTVEGHPLSFTTYIANEAHSHIATSLMLPLTAVSDLQDGSTLVLYAATPGAFVDLAADLSFALRLDLSTTVLDQHRAAPTGPDGIQGLQPWSDINQAIGVLLGRGHTPASARIELRRLADLDSNNLHHAAAMVLAEAAQPRNDPRG